MHRRPHRWFRAVAVPVSLVVPVVLVTACGGSSEGGTGTTEPTTTTTTAGPRGGTPTTGPAPQGGSDRTTPVPTIESFTITPEEAPCRDGKVLATMSWRVSPPDAQVWVKDEGVWMGARAGDRVLGPFPTEVRDVPVPDWVACDGEPYALGLIAQTEGSARFSGLSGKTVMGTP